jgi:predicted double-glycine peptidase
MKIATKRLIVLSCLLSGGCLECLPSPGSEKHLILVPTVRQSTPYTCGVASMQSVLMYYGHEYREDVLAQALGTTEADGTPYKNMITFAQSLGLPAEARMEMTSDDLKTLIDQKKPVIVTIQAWADPPVDYANDWNDGHYVVAIGYDTDNFYFMDPSTLGHYTSIPIPSFEIRWHDEDSLAHERLIHPGIIIGDGQSKYNPTEITPLD